MELQETLPEFEKLVESVVVDQEMQKKAKENDERLVSKMSTVFVTTNSLNYAFLCFYYRRRKTQRVSNVHYQLLRKFHTTRILLTLIMKVISEQL